ncbi:cytochrome c [Undibacterium sp. TS12]|uniref:c-type cytochrome n=1 Tax=Undibacterium sp. TS12 TaxID=2908202 RepID=UPI001F4C903A|nr:cytochrome c [Undibacterium sp. TS12]MCH8618635.1 cytochrome c [Undibacterium sp. TS12]
MKKSLLIASLLSGLSFAAYAGGDIEAGKEATKKFNCASCHGENYSKPIDPAYPKLAGQHADYLAQALRAYQRGGDAANGRANPTMAAQAKALSNKDIQNIAAYLHSLPSELVLKK